MKTHDVIAQLALLIWPIKLPDVLTVLALGVAFSIFGPGSGAPDARWASWWAGVAAGLFVVMVLVVRRVRREMRSE